MKRLTSILLAFVLLLSLAFNADTLSGAESPKTGDDFNLSLWLSIGIISLAGLAFTLKYKKSQFSAIIKR